VDDPIHILLKELLAAKEPAAIDRLSLELRTALHERISAIRRQARSLTAFEPSSDRKKHPCRHGKKQR
jgi:hypothetical protein